MRQLSLAVGDSFSSGVTAVAMDWPGLVRNLSEYTVSDETLAAFNAKSKDEQLRLKDRGWWNGNTYSGKRRAADQIQSVDVIWLDLDNCKLGAVERLRAALDPMLGDVPYAAFLGSTRKHSATAPRLRLVLPLTRAATVDESDAIKRKLAEVIGMAQADPVSFRANQVSFWPSRCIDGDVIAEAFDGEWLDPSAFLAQHYPSGWQDRTHWPLHPGESKGVLANKVDGKRTDPRDRDDLIGTFTRTYDIQTAIAELIPGTYLEGSPEGRYTHVAGSTANGAAVYENGLWLYSHHQTDPVNGILCNSFDLVRIHRFGFLDDGAAADTPSTKLPSFGAMSGWAMELPAIKDALRADAIGEFEAIAQLPDAPTPEAREAAVATLYDDLEKNHKTGKVTASYANVVALLRRHPDYAGLSFNANNETKVWRSPMPWHTGAEIRSIEDATAGLTYRTKEALRLRDHMIHIIRGMELPTETLIEQCVEVVCPERSYHPIHDAFDRLPVWDGVPRVEQLLPRYVNTPDDLYHRQVGRKLLCGIVARALTPGCKFDYSVIFIGLQGVGKSTFFATLAGHTSWFTDSMPPIDKRADCVNAIRSQLIVEWGEMQDLKRSEVESVKAFMTSRVDKVRLSYEAQTRAYPRQCVIVGTSNSETPLRDQSGNRRFWPVYCNIPQGKLIDSAALAAEREQLFAEAKTMLLAGERLYLTDEAESLARAMQETARDVSPMEEAIHQWLAGHTPSVAQPAGIDGGDFYLKAERRDLVCTRQIACEVFNIPNSGAGMTQGQQQAIVAVLNSHGQFHRRPTAVRMKPYGVVKVWGRKEVTELPRVEGNVVPITHKKAPAAADFDL